MCYPCTKQRLGNLSWTYNGTTPNQSEIRVLEEIFPLSPLLAEILFGLWSSDAWFLKSFPQGVM